MIRSTVKAKRRKPVPWVVTFKMAFLPDDLSDREWEVEVRKIIRTAMPTLRKQLNTPAFIELYDERVSALIEDELAVN